MFELLNKYLSKPVLLAMLVVSLLVIVSMSAVSLKSESGRNFTKDFKSAPYENAPQVNREEFENFECSQTGERIRFMRENEKYSVFLDCAYPVMVNGSPQVTKEYWGLYDKKDKIYYYFDAQSSEISKEGFTPELVDIFGKKIFLNFCYEMCYGNLMVDLEEARSFGDKDNEKSIYYYELTSIFRRNEIRSDSFVRVNNRALLFGDSKIYELNLSNFNIIVLKELPLGKIFTGKFVSWKFPLYPDFSVDGNTLRYKFYDKQSVDTYYAADRVAPPGTTPKPLPEGEGLLVVE